MARGGEVCLGWRPSCCPPRVERPLTCPASLSSPSSLGRRDRSSSRAQADDNQSRPEIRQRYPEDGWVAPVAARPPESPAVAVPLISRRLWKDAAASACSRASVSSWSSRLVLHLKMQGAAAVRIHLGTGPSRPGRDGCHPSFDGPH